MVFLRHELKLNFKAFIIWCLCIAISCCGCILLYDSVAEEMSDVAKTFSEMGGFSAAFGMDKISIATIEGYYATEISMIFLLGSTMFAAMTGAALLSKEEEGHTSEFLYTLPVRRTYIVLCKYISLIVLVLLFNMVCICFDFLGFAFIGEKIDLQIYLVYHLAALVMQIEIGSICFLLSSVTNKRQIGISIGLVILFYFMDIMCRIVPDIEGIKYITPFYYANAADLFSGIECDIYLIISGIAVSIVTIGLSVFAYCKRDLKP